MSSTILPILAMCGEESLTDASCSTCLVNEPPKKYKIKVQTNICYHINKGAILASAASAVALPVF